MSARIEVDWDKDGFGSADDDVTLDTQVSEGRGDKVTCSYGRDLTSPLAPIVSGRGGFTLDNMDRKYSPRYTGSPLFGRIKPARPVRITRTVPTGLYTDFYSDFYPTGGDGELSDILSDIFPSGGGEVFTLFYGVTDDNPINPDVESKTASVGLIDELGFFRGVKISTPLYSGIRTDEAIGYILDAAGWPAERRSLDAGATVIPYWWEEGEDALAALDKIVESEGSPAMLHMGTEGEVIFRSRHHRLIDTASVSPQATWSADGGPEPVMGVPFSYDEAWRNIINTGLISVDVRTPQEEEDVWTLEGAIAFAASESKQFIAAGTDPFRNAVAPVEATDFILTSGTITSVTLSRTSGASTTITVTAGGGGAQIDGLKLRAQPVRTAYTVQVTASDATSIADYGQRSFPHDLPWCNQWDAQAILETAIEQRAQPLPVLGVTFLLGTDDPVRVAGVLSRNLSNRIIVNEPETATAGDFFLESIGHEFTADFDHVVNLGLEAVPPDGPATAANIFLIGGGVGHQIGSGVLAR